MTEADRLIEALAKLDAEIAADRLIKQPVGQRLIDRAKIESQLQYAQYVQSLKK